MFTFTTTYGETRTLEDIIPVLEREKELIKDAYYCESGRCYLGAIFDFQSNTLKESVWDSERNFRKLYYTHMGTDPVGDNNDFDGSEEERCQYMIKRTRKLIEKVER